MMEILFNTIVGMKKSYRIRHLFPYLVSTYPQSFSQAMILSL